MPALSLLHRLLDEGVGSVFFAAPERGLKTASSFSLDNGEAKQGAGWTRTNHPSEGQQVHCGKGGDPIPAVIWSPPVESQ
ncbi:hypothetical protein AVEN_119056-1 [Araneus ventricosus]|uniref:Uncharacterized protein n=1 Tax=Araneus ventricosus TaxID=182803 RepID=A0A4Y2PMX0_ARAVE|nr:hypothetical protein AVEN_119056-1 [Araneus ventricosus]